MTKRPSIAARLRTSLARDERGTAVVEFALVLIPLSLIIFGILDFGRALNYYNDLTQLAGQGARAAAVNQNPDGTPADGSFGTQLACQADSPELRSRIHVQVTTAPAATDTAPVGKPITVTTSFTFNFIPLVHAVSINLSSAQTERYESGNAPPAAITGLGTCP